MEIGSQQSDRQTEELKNEFRRLSPGDIWDIRFEIVALLGQGASGIVYKAKHLVLDKIVAIKILKPELVSEGSAQRFRNEAVLLSSFDHPNIVGFRSFGCTAAGIHYMVLEYLEGETLSDLLKRHTTLAAPRAVQIFKEITAGLSYAHEKQVLHRDIKPSNVMIFCDEGKEAVKLLDFGIFKAIVESDQNLTKTGQLLGSTNYMSPEQCRGTELDVRSDIYSLGCLMYETVCGVPPMQDQNELMTMHNHVHKVITSVPAKQPIPAQLAQVILKCIEKNADKRYKNAEELFADLSAINFAAKVNKSASIPGLWIGVGACVVLLAAVFATQLNRPSPKQAALPATVSTLENHLRRSRASSDEYRKLVGWIDLNYRLSTVDLTELLKNWNSAKAMSISVDGLSGPSHGDQIESRTMKFLEKHADEPWIELRCQLSKMQYLRGEYKKGDKTILSLGKRFPGQSDDEYFNQLYVMYKALFQSACMQGDGKAQRVILYNEIEALKHCASNSAPMGVALTNFALLEDKDKEEAKSRAHAKQAVEFFRQAIRTGDPSAPDVINVLSDLQHLGQSEFVVEVDKKFAERYSLARSVDPFVLAANLTVAKALGQLHKYDESCKRYEQILHCAPTAYEAASGLLIDLHAMHSDKKIPQIASANLEYAFGSKPDEFMTIYNNECSCLKDIGVDPGFLLNIAEKYAATHTDGSVAAKLYKNIADLWYEKGDFKTGLRLAKLAIYKYAQAGNPSEDWQDAYLLESGCLWKLGQKKEAMSELKEARKHGGSDVPNIKVENAYTQRLLEQSDSSIEDWQQSVQVAKKFSSTEPDLAGLVFLNFSAYLHYHYRDKEAVESADTAISCLSRGKIKGDQLSTAYLMKALSLHSLGQFDRANVTLAQAEKVVGVSVVQKLELQDVFGENLFGAGRKNQAIELHKRLQKEAEEAKDWYHYCTISIHLAQEYGEMKQAAVALKIAEDALAVMHKHKECEDGIPKILQAIDDFKHKLKRS